MILFCFFSFLWSVLVCILLCPPTHTCLCIYEVNQLPDPSSSSSFKPHSNTKSRLLTELEDRLLSTLSSEP